MATPGSAPLTLLIDLASFTGRRCPDVSGSDGSGAQHACQQAVAHLLALSLAGQPGARWVYHFVDSRLPPHAFTRVAEFVKFAGVAQPTYQDGSAHTLVTEH